jgi:hypothetical protein
MTNPALGSTGRDGDGTRRGRAPSPDRFLPRAFALFMTLHGIVHVVGFTVPWRLGGPRGAEYTTSLFNQTVEVGDPVVKLVGLLWLATAFAFLAVALLLWRRHALALRATVGLLILSAGLCLAGLPASIYGLVIDAVLLGLLAVKPDRLVAAP